MDPNTISPGMLPPSPRWQARPLKPVLRMLDERDQPFLLNLYRFTHGSMHQVLSHISNEAAEKLLQLQLRAHAASCRQSFPESMFYIVCTPDGQPAGRLTTAHTATYLHLLDIALLPAWCGRGWGTHLIAGLQMEAATAQIPLHLAVSRSNRAQNLFRRLGFTITTQHELDIGMTWFPPDKSIYSRLDGETPHG